MAKVIGIGGIFFKFKNPAFMKEWYQRVLGMKTNDYGVLFQFNSSQAPGYLQLGVFEENTNYFGSEQQQSMINFRVDDLESMLSQLKSNNVEILSQIDIYEYGKFLHISDPEGNRIELWEPIDSVFANETSIEMR